MMRNSLVLLLLVCFLTPILSANTDEETKAPEPNTKASGRVEAAGTVLDEIQAPPTSASLKKFLVRPNVWPWFRRCSTEDSSSAAVMAKA